ncbi:MAG: response regulator transcription factor [Candidatus Sulfopaludibacter sp.]|nr:response regulator transcription factor [Candidatus Sulfopaludibacter sp.]
MTVNVVLVQDHKAIAGLRAVFACSPDLHVAGEATNGVEAVALCRRLRPDLVLIDLGLPGVTGIQLTTEILHVCPRAKVVMFSAYDDEDSILAAIRAGVRGFVLEKSPAQEILQAVRTVAAGGTYLSSSASSRLLACVQRSGQGGGVVPDVGSLSPREMQVLRLVAGGMRTKEVASELNLEHNTIRTYRRTMMRKLGVKNLAGVIEAAHLAGLVPAPHRSRH